MKRPSKGGRLEGGEGKLTERQDISGTGPGKRSSPLDAGRS